MKASSRDSLIFYIFLISAGLVGAGLVIAAVSLYGPGLTHDSAAYIYAAKSLLQGRGFEYFGYPSPFIQWPPFYPMLLAAAGFLGMDHLAASGTVNAAAHGLIIIFVGYWMYTRLQYKLLAVFGTLLPVFSLPLIQVSKYLWTETLFLLFFLLFYINFENYLKTQVFRHLASAGIFTALACLDRYAGVTIALAAAIFLLFRKKSLLMKIFDIFVYGLISFIPLAVWIIRNFIVSSTLLGVRIPSTYGLMLNIRRSVDSVCTWIKPDAMLRGFLPDVMIKAFMLFSVLLPAIIILVFVALYISDLAKRKFLSEFADSKRVLVEWNPGYFAITFQVSFSIIYTVYLLASATKVLFEPINSRYLVPLYIPAVIALLAAVDITADRLKETLQFTVRKHVVIILLGLFLIYPALNTFAAVIDSAENGAGGYSTKAWQDNKLIAYIQQGPRNTTYYSNNADAAGALTGIRTFYPPKREGPYMYGLEQFKKAVERDESTIFVWFKGGIASSLYNIEDLGKLYRLEEIEQNDNGAVYRIVK